MKHFIDIDNFSYKELRSIINQAKKIKKNNSRFINILNNKSLGLLFTKQSARTRLSFAIGIQKLGGNIIELNSNEIGFGKRESDEDILRTISQYLDILMIRNNDHKKLLTLSSKNIIPIVNGLSDFSHPCQILSDIFTLEEKIGSIKDKTLVWLGDYNNVLVSFIQAAELFKFKLNILSPEKLTKQHKKIFKNKTLEYVNFYKDINKGLNNADCVMTDVWISMGEVDTKNKIKLLKKYQVNQNVMNKAKKNAIFMHCLPAHRNEEVTDEIIDGNQSIVWTQARNRMYVQQSILIYLLNHDKK
jgi:ornithine carbamoyltransferase